MTTQTTSPIIHTSHLGFGFHKNEPMLKDLNIAVEKGAIYGFLGPNGAGKTTTIRLIMGLLPPTTGSISLFGSSLASNRMATLTRIGSLIEQPALYEQLSGWDNLDITRIIRRVEKKKIREVLELVRLTPAAHRKVKTYSMGMKQRLGVALALLSNPDLLILDEPVNGLDPTGIIETRELLLRLNKELGITIFLSSHLLAEMEKLVTHIGILHKGALIFQGTMAALQQINHHANVIRIKTNNNAKADFLLRQQQYLVTTAAQQLLEVPYENNEQVAGIAALLVKAGISIYLLDVAVMDLEHTFIQFIDKHH